MKTKRRDRLNKRKGKMGKGWGTSRKHRSPSSHIFATDRWVVIPPMDKPPLAFLSEEKAMKIAAAIAADSGMNVEVDHQVITGHRVKNPEDQEMYDVLKKSHPELAAHYLEAVWGDAPEEK